MPTAIPFTSLHPISNARSGADTRANQEWTGAVGWHNTIGKNCHWLQSTSPHSRASHQIIFPPRRLFLFASSPRPTNSRPSGTVSAQPVRDRSHLSLRVLATKNKNHPFLIAQEKESCSLMRRLVLFSFVLSVMTILVISLAFGVIRTRCASSLDPIAMDHPCITPKE